MYRMNNYTIWLTTDCNLRCKYCYEGVEKKSIVMDQDLATKIVDFICENFDENSGELCIDFHGGEPLLNYEVLVFFIETLRVRMPNCKKNYSLTTNATVLNDEKIKYLAQNIKNVSVSIDGCKEKHDYYRIFPSGKGSYDIAAANSLKLLDLLGERLRVRMTFSPKTIGGLSEDMQNLYNMGFKTVSALPDIFSNEWKKEDFVLLKKEIEQAKRKINREKVSFNLLDPLMVQKKGKCLGGIVEIDIYPNGDFYPCTMASGIEEFRIGNIECGIDIEKRNNILANSDEEMHECAGCDMYSFCECVRCRIVNQLTMGDYMAPNFVQCMYNNTIIDANGYILM